MGLLNDGRGRDQPLVGALVEVWQWLFARSLIAHDPIAGSSKAITVTPLGKSVSAAGSVAKVKAAERLDLQLHPLIATEARQQFLMGNTSAPLSLPRGRSRSASAGLPGADAGLLGSSLMQVAFAPSSGPLADRSAVPGEQVATTELF